MKSEKDLRLEALDKLSELDQELGLDDMQWPKDQEMEGFKLVCTCRACPEQYDVFDSKGDKVGYLRLRHGRFRADMPDCGGETVYSSNTKGDGVFSEDERQNQLLWAVAAIKSRIQRKE